MASLETPFVGREKELAELAALLNKQTASLVVIKGRRRVGKSRLVEKFAEGRLFYELTGLGPDKKITAQQQRDHIATQLSLISGMPQIKAEDWNQIFVALAREVENKRAIILLDEISWMGSKDETFIGKLKSAWDVYFKKNPKLILVLCGSVSTWIEKNILRSKLFMGRISLPITLKELSVPLCNEMLRQMRCKFSVIEKFKILAVTGGIPRYLEEIQPNLSAEDNIKRLCFQPNGILVQEFGDIFTDIFSSRHESYKKIVEILVGGPATQEDIHQKTGIARGGYLTECVEELIMAGIISRHYTWRINTAEESTLSQFRLRDHYIRFYLKYIEKNLGKIEEGHFGDIDIGSLPGWQSIMGLQFENLVLNNRRYLIDMLNIKPSHIVADNPYFQRKTKAQQGCQIDYMIQTKENVLYIFEIKFSKNEIRSFVIEQVQETIKRLKYPKGYAVLPILIHINGVSPTVEDSDFFYQIIDFSQLLTDESGR